MTCRWSIQRPPRIGVRSGNSGSNFAHCSSVKSCRVCTRSVYPALTLMIVGTRPSSAASGSVMDPVRALQHALYRAAKADPGRRFHALGDKIYRRDVLERAWEDVRRNGGAAGIDRITIADVEEYGVSRLLDEVAAALKEGRWRPLPARRVFIPKPGSLERRPLSIPSVADRVVQAAVKIVLEPIFEADMLA